MNYLPSLILHDIKFQFRHGFYMVYGIISVIYIVILKLLGEGVSNILSPIIIFSDPTFIGFLFVGAIIFFEREQRVVEALFVTPINKGAYILSKCISLTILSLFVITLITIFIHGFRVNWFYLYLGVILSSSFFIILGMILSYYLRKITIYIIFGGLLMGPFSMPIIYYLGFWNSPLFYIIPTTASIKLIAGGINGGLNLFDVIYSVSYLAILCAISYFVLLKIKGDSSEDI